MKKSTIVHFILLWAVATTAQVFQNERISMGEYQLNSEYSTPVPTQCIRPDLPEPTSSNSFTRSSGNIFIERTDAAGKVEKHGLYSDTGKKWVKATGDGASSVRFKVTDECPTCTYRLKVEGQSGTLAGPGNSPIDEPIPQEATILRFEKAIDKSKALEEHFVKPMLDEEVELSNYYRDEDEQLTPNEISEKRKKIKQSTVVAVTQYWTWIVQSNVLTPAQLEQSLKRYEEDKFLTKEEFETQLKILAAYANLSIALYDKEKLGLHPNPSTFDQATKPKETTAQRKVRDPKDNCEVTNICLNVEKKEVEIEMTCKDAAGNEYTFTVTTDFKSIGLSGISMKNSDGYGFGVSTEKGETNLDLSIPVNN